LSAILTAGNRHIDLSIPVCMGIINVTPDSFSDGGQLRQAGANLFKVDVDKTLRRTKQMVADGAVFIDVGGESTRPGAQQITADEELERVIPVVEAITRNFDICVSVDSSKAIVIEEAINAGAEVVNDIRALQNKAVLQKVVNSNVAICLMHMRGHPQTMQYNCNYDDVIAEVLAFLKTRVLICERNGIVRERLLVDPGFGFGKTLKQNYQLLKYLPDFEVMKLPVLIGVSRKSMIGDVVGKVSDQRLAGSIVATTYALLGGANIIRTHDVAATVDAIRVHSAYLDA